MKNKAARSPKSGTLKTNADSPKSSARLFKSSGSSRFSPYQIDVCSPVIQNRRNPLSGSSGGPEVETTTVPSEFLESIKPDIRACDPEAEQKCACNGIRSVSSLDISASASVREI